MTMLYNIKKELFPEDYKQLPAVKTLQKAEIKALLRNLEQAAGNAACYGSDLLLCALLDDIETLKSII